MFQSISKAEEAALLSSQILEFKENPDNCPLARYPGVTRVLSGTKDMTGLDAWRARVGDEEADRIINESKMIGSSLDKIFNDALDPDNRSNFDLRLYKDEVGFKLFRQLEPYIKHIDPVAVQLKVWSDRMRMMGYLDCLGYYKGVLTLIDCKNAKREKTAETIHDYYLQCTAYSMMVYEMFGIKVKQLGLLIARRDQAFPQVEVKPIAPYVPEVLDRVRQYYSGVNE